MCSTSWLLFLHGVFFMACHHLVRRLNGRHMGLPGSNTFIPTLPSLEPHSQCSPGVPSSHKGELPHSSWPLQTDRVLALHHCPTHTSGYKSTSQGKYSTFYQWLLPQVAELHLHTIKFPTVRKKSQGPILIEIFGFHCCHHQALPAGLFAHPPFISSGYASAFTYRK